MRRQIGTIEQRVGHGWNQRHVSSSVLLINPQHRRRIETSDHDLLGSEHGGSLRPAPSIGVKQRNGMQIDGCFGFAVQARDRHRM